jgi:hypothetical protein
MATGRIGVTPNLGLRWSKAPTGGTTSLSGNDDNSLPLAYSVGYEAVYRNGVLLSRGNDYTATDGTSITLIDATITGDIIEVFANQTVALTDTYSQSAANAKFINNTLTTTTGDIIYASAANTPARLGIGSTGQVLKVSGGVPAWGSDVGAMTLISRTTFSNVASQAFDNVFTSTYKQYMVIIENISAATSSDDLLLQLRYAGPTTQASGYYGSLNFSTWAASLTTTLVQNATSMTIAASSGSSTEPSTATMYFSQVGNSSQYGSFYGHIMTGVNESQGTFGGRATTARTYTGFIFSSSSTNITGTVAIYGLATA